LVVIFGSQVDFNERPRNGTNSSRKEDQGSWDKIEKKGVYFNDDITGFIYSGVNLNLEPNNSQTAQYEYPIHAYNDLPFLSIYIHHNTMSESDEKQPPGGHDDTALQPSTEPTYTVKITFHRATNLPLSDIGSGSTDPYILAQANTGRSTRHKEDPPLRYRSPTVQRSKAPTWDAHWVLAGIPASGFTLKSRIYDEDPDDHDDRLGKVEIETGPISEGWQGIKEKEYKVKKSGADVRAYTLRWCSVMIHPKRSTHASLVISIELVGMTKEEVGKAYTVNNFWRVHYSPMIGRLAGVKSKDNKGVEQYK
jgi:hypothetical protein